MHNEKHKIRTLSNLESSLGNSEDINLGFKELKKPPLCNEHQRIWELKRGQFLKLYKAGFKLPEDIIKEYKLHEL